MNKRGFTVVELMTTFILISIISVLLINLTITLKEIYISGDMKTTLLTKQGTMTDKIMKDINNYNLYGITSCGNNCLNFEYDVYTRQLKVDKTNKILSYDNYAIKLGKENYFGDISIEKNDFDIGSIIKINVPIKNKLLKEDYGLKIVHQVDDSFNYDSTIIFE